MVKETVLVTGGAGYVGSHAVVKLLENDYPVVVIDNLSNCYKEKNIVQPECLIRAQILSGKRVKFFPVDITNEEGLKEVFKKNKIHCVMHFAALKAVAESCQIPLKYYSNNVSGTLTLLKVMSEYGVKNLVFSSSATVYGDPKELPITEDHSTGNGCTNPYGRTKYMIEEILKDMCKADPAWCVMSLRYFNPVGAHESGKIGEDPAGIPNNLMPYVAQVAIGKLPELKVYGNDYNTPDGTGVRDYIHIQDLAEGHIKALEKLFRRDCKGFFPYNLGTGKGHSVLEVVNMFAEVSRKDIPYVIVERRQGDIASTYCDANLAKKELSWMACKDLRNMCEDMWRWQKTNPNGYETSEHILEQEI